MEREIDALISGCGRKTATFLQLLKETPFRPIEALRLRWRDIDAERRTINLIQPAKHSRPRQPPISLKLINMLNGLPHNSEFIFTSNEPTEKTLNDFRRNFIYSRKHVAKKLQNPRLLKITFRTFRHWKASTTYHKTRDILFVQRLLGHKRLEHTLIYTHLIDCQEDEYTVKVACSIEECKALLETGFEYVCEVNGSQLFRKRK